jgi:hypothetical protein
VRRGRPGRSDGRRAPQLSLPFHVQVERGHRRAAVFNLDGDRLNRDVIAPWLQGSPIELGDRDWEPRETRLTVIEGPELTTADLAHGRGWDNARRSARDVTADVLAQASIPRVAVLADSEQDERRLDVALARHGIDTLSWPELKAAIVAGRVSSLGAVAVVVALRDADPSAQVLFDAGLAAGALQGAVLVACLDGAAAPAALGDLHAAALDPEDGRSVTALVARLR